MPFAKIYMSHNRQEWWYGHLARALTQHAEIVPCPMARYNQPGHLPEADINSIIPQSGKEKAFYLGSFDQIFRGISKLPMPTAIWTDFLVPHSGFYLLCHQLFDVVFCTQKISVTFLKSTGIRHAEWIPFGFDPALRNEPDTEKIYEVGFVGSLALPPTRAQRLALLGRLEQKHRLNDYRKPVYGDDMMRVYNQSKIVVNIPVPGGSCNMRTFEAMASGALLLTPKGDGERDGMFRDGVHFVSYRDADDLMDKTAYYLRNDSERQEIAQTGMREVLAKHSYNHRASRMVEIMENAARTRSQDPKAIAAAYAAFYVYLNRADLLGELALSRGVALPTRARAAVRAGWALCKRIKQGRRDGT